MGNILVGNLRILIKKIYLNIESSWLEQYGSGKVWIMCWTMVTFVPLQSGDFSFDKDLDYDYVVRTVKAAVSRFDFR